MASVIYNNQYLNYIIYKYFSHYKITILQHFYLYFTKINIAANKIDMKQISEDLKTFLTKEMENNPKKITKRIIGKMSTKFDELSIRIEAVHRKTDTIETLAK